LKKKVIPFSKLHNKFFKNKDGIGLDVLAFDIQRGDSQSIFQSILFFKISFSGRDHGLPTWIETRRKCGLTSNFTCFQDLNRLFPKQTVELLEKTYDSIEDIDLIVGGALESFSFLDRQLVGPTFSCLYHDQYKRLISGDVYFFSHSNNPNPFTPAQMKAITDVSFNHLICTNSKIEFTNQNWLLVDSLKNPKVSCRNFKNMDLKSWLNV
jgi:Animal haem peroxidase